MSTQPPPYGYGPPGQQMPPPGATPPGYGQPPFPPTGPPAPPHSFGASPPPPPPKRNLAALWVVLGAVVIAGLVAGAIVIIGGGSGSDEAADTTSPRRTTTVPDTTEPTTDAPTTTTQITEPPSTTTTLPVDSSGIDLGHGVTLPLPEGWERTDGPDDEVVQISNDTLKVDAQALSREAGEDPASGMQEYIDLFDGDFASIGYSPVTLRGTAGAAGELRNYGLYYRAIDSDFTGFDGAVYLLQRTDGLTVLLDYYAERGAESMGLPDDDYAALIDSILAAPSLGDTADVPEAAPFRVTSVHPMAVVDGFAAFTLPPGWADQSVPGAAILTNGVDETVIGTKVSAQPDAGAAAAAAQADFAARYPGFVYEAPETIDAWANLERRDINISAAADPAIDARIRYGVITVFYDPASQNALTFSRFWYGDVSSDGSDPNDGATDFLFDVYTDSFDTIP